VPIRDRRRFPVIAALSLATALAGTPVLGGHGAGGLVPSYSVEHLKRMLDAGDPVVLVDVRPGPAYRGGHLPGARSLPVVELAARLTEIPRSGRVIVYGESIIEASEAHDRLRDHGYRNVGVLEEGFAGWVRQGYPIERRRTTSRQRGAAVRRAGRRRRRAAPGGGRAPGPPPRPCAPVGVSPTAGGDLRILRAGPLC
jgi:rhodanese-related sulfurtransferase